MPNARSRLNFLPLVMCLYFIHTVWSKPKINYHPFRSVFLKHLNGQKKLDTDSCGLCGTVVCKWRYRGLGMPGAIKTAAFVNKAQLSRSVVADKLGVISIFLREIESDLVIIQSYWFAASDNACFTNCVYCLLLRSTTLTFVVVVYSVVWLWPL